MIDDKYSNPFYKGFYAHKAERESETIMDVVADETDVDYQTKAAAILADAVYIINGPRQSEYGSPKVSFGQIADLWTAYLTRKDSHIQITPLDVVNMMTLLKISRASNGFHRDSYVDICGYAALSAELTDAD